MFAHFFIAALGLLPLAAAVVALALELLYGEPDDHN
jgi:hypothetical protein